MNFYTARIAFSLTLPVFFGYIAIGIPFGLVIAEAGYPWYLALFMSLAMYTGAGQYVAVGLFAAKVPLLSILLTEFLVSIRHIVYGFSLISTFNGTGAWKPYLIFALTDETYALIAGTQVPPNVNKGTFYGIISLLNQCYWVLGTIIGVASFSILAHFNLAHFLNGIDFALTALFAVILTEQIKKSQSFFAPLLGIIATVVSIILSTAGLLPSSNIMLLSIAIGITTILLFRKRRGKENE